MFNKSEVLEVIMDFRAGIADDRVIDILLEYIELTNVKQELEKKLENAIFTDTYYEPKPKRIIELEETKVEQAENFVSNTVVFPGSYYKSPWVDCTGFLKYGFKFAARDIYNKVAYKYQTRIEWSHDGLNPIAEEENPTSYVKARYVRLAYKNTDSQAHSLDTAIILFN